MAGEKGRFGVRLRLRLRHGLSWHLLRGVVRRVDGKQGRARVRVPPCPPEHVRERFAGFAGHHEAVSVREAVHGRLCGVVAVNEEREPGGAAFYAAALSL